MTTTPIDPFLAPLPRRLLGRDDLELLAPLELIDPAPSAGSTLRLPPPRRDLGTSRPALAEALAESNRAHGHPRVDDLCRKLANPDTRVVVTGQQAGFLGGPLYTLTKAVAASLWAEQLEQQGQPAVALFWIATEDHDHAEVQSCCMLGADGPVSFSLEGGNEDLRPVGDLELGSDARRVLDLVASELGAHQRAELERLTKCCGEKDRYGAAFAGLLVGLLGQRCPLLLDSQEPEVKRLQQPWLRKLIERRRQVDVALSDRESEIEQRGFSPQVAPQTDWSPLFLLDSEGRRRRIGWRGGDRYVLRGAGSFETESSGQEAGQPISHLLEVVDEEPHRLSPGAVARPAIQDAILGTSVFVVGPGELSYLTQAAALYPVLDLPPTLIALRPQMLVLDQRRRDQLIDLEGRGVDLATVLGEPEALDSRLAEIAGGEPVSAVASEILQRIDQLEPSLVAIEPQLRSALAKTRGHVERSLGMLTERAVRSLAQSDEVLRSRAATLRTLCRPGGSLQERVVTAAPFYCHYGAALTETLFRDLDLDPRLLQVITPRLDSALGHETVVDGSRASEASVSEVNA